MVRNYVRTMKPAPRPEPIVRFETESGQQMQVDWRVFRLKGKRVSLILSTLGGADTPMVCSSIMNNLMRCASVMNKRLKSLAVYRWRFCTTTCKLWLPSVMRAATGCNSCMQVYTTWHITMDIYPKYADPIEQKPRAKLNARSATYGEASLSPDHAISPIAGGIGSGHMLASIPRRSGHRDSSLNPWYYWQVLLPQPRSELFDLFVGMDLNAP